MLSRVTLNVAFAENRIDVRARDYIQDLAASGRYHFTSSEAFEAIPGSPAAIRAQLRRLRKQGLIAEPARSFHVIVPPEFRRIGCPPAEQFIDQLMKVQREPYYVALLSAAERHGAAHQRPQYLQVMLRKNRRPLECGHVRVEFVARGDLEQLPTTTLNTRRGVLHYATPEVTALELVGYPNHAGGLSNVATVLSELAEELDASKLLDAARLSPVSWSQRLGYLLERLGEEDLARGISAFVQDKARSLTPLRRAASTSGAKRSPTWKLIVNADVELDQ
ncbi:type IV toxin-antitoxin system AbiEi family antitoxin [Planctomycetota bacterium]